ncbi:hypothetical protein Dsin_022096 [Dipteronia sinensis]|uniref:Uncharacterized protein n=1 Tax=Dipteronia sinensis TaxID=43782 RepID=A0AAE0A2C5_9ROSI|nr:hypothetical protein Dsin_022096 [Dipteronia sinensis]
MKPTYNWWTPLAHSKMEKIGGPQFSAWTSEYVPAYKLQIDASRFKDVKFEGWRKSAENSALDQLCLPHLRKGEKYLGEQKSPPSFEFESIINQPVDAAALVKKKIKDAVGWSGDIITEMSVGAWIGEIPIFLKVTHEDDAGGEDKSINSAALVKDDADINSYPSYLVTEYDISVIGPSWRIFIFLCHLSLGNVLLKILQQP